VITVVKNDDAELLKTGKSLYHKDLDIVWIIKNGGKEFSPSIRKLIYTTGIQRIEIIESADGGIYEAMNEAYSRAREISRISIESDEPQWLWFINAGDLLFGLEELVTSLSLSKTKGKHLMVNAQRSEMLTKENPFSFDNFSLKGFILGNFKLSHQAIICNMFLLPRKKLFNTRYRVAADFEFMLSWYIQKEHVNFPSVFVLEKPNGYSDVHLDRLEIEKAQILLNKFVNSGRVIYFVGWYYALIAVLKTYTAKKMFLFRLSRKSLLKWQKY